MPEVNLNSKNNPFVKASNSTGNRKKILIWGESGVGKTILSLQFPKPVVFDFERGTVPYANKYDFHTPEKCSTIEQFKTALAWLEKNEHDFETIIVDPITSVWDLLIEEWTKIYLKRRKAGQGAHNVEFYDLGGKEWREIKNSFRRMLDRIKDLDMHFVCTARSATKYERQGSEYMKAIGEKPEADNNIDHWFDTVVQLTMQGTKHVALCTKDRWESIPQGKIITIDKKTLTNYLAKD